MENTDTKTKVKKLSDRFNSFEELVKFVGTGRITFEKCGRVAFFKDGYPLKADTKMNQTSYGYKYETDQQLKKDGVPREKTFLKGTLVRMSYKPFNDYYLFTYCVNDGTNGTYNRVHSEYWDGKQANAEWEACKKLFPTEHPEFNSIGNFYAWVRNGQVKLSN